MVEDRIPRNDPSRYAPGARLVDCGWRAVRIEDDGVVVWRKAFAGTEANPVGSERREPDIGDPSG